MIASSEGAGPCHVSVDVEGRYVYAANYLGGTVAMYPIGDEGRLEAVTETAVPKPVCVAMLE